MGWENELVASARLRANIAQISVKNSDLYYIAMTTSFPWRTAAHTDDERHFLVGRFDMLNEAVTQCEVRDDASRTSDLEALDSSEISAYFADNNANFSPSTAFTMTVVAGGTVEFLDAAE